MNSIVGNLQKILNPEQNIRKRISRFVSLHADEIELVVMFVNNTYS